MRSTRRFVLAGAMALSVIALVATPASAAVELPHDDTNSQNWQSVVAFDRDGQAACEGVPPEVTYPEIACPISGYTSPWTIRHIWGDTSNCYPGEIEGSVSFGGEVQLTNAWWNHDIGAFFCAWYREAGLPWQGRLCAHLPTGEFWLRQEMTVQDSYGSGTVYEDGVTFGQFLGGAVRFGTQADPADIHYVVDEWEFELGHAAFFAMDSAPIVYASGENPVGLDPEPCGWAELQ
jgi:hypothetical protein